MISINELKCIKTILTTENEMLGELNKILNSVNEPQLRSELQNVISSHRNHMSKLIKVLEKSNEQ